MFKPGKRHFRHACRCCRRDRAELEAFAQELGLGQDLLASALRDHERGGKKGVLVALQDRQHGRRLRLLSLRGLCAICTSLPAYTFVIFTYVVHLGEGGLCQPASLSHP